MLHQHSQCDKASETDASTVSAPINEEVEIKKEQIEHENNGTDNLN